ncbi:hypothetical protein VB715_12010 [Crocosphaera sp. UHCC 0190]|uniref:hypothetical protein n=1 Tax=Crocosphaera sp. UHCC 0190 TaxID=3110246 RepID=UPI002B21310C|nr:hypothetical protein [Crocosphaera sp. UHCC 0190]MEA5510490.1 hypothetical protein [Crocosphaera sp. UHCC 0190]
MSISKPEIKQLLERVIFEETYPQDWVEDVWALSAMHGDSGAKLLDVFYALIECCSEEQLENLLHNLYEKQLK